MRALASSFRRQIEPLMYVGANHLPRVQTFYMQMRAQHSSYGKGWISKCADDRLTAKMMHDLIERFA